MYVDFTREQLDSYRSAQTCPADFDEFWSHTLAEAAAHPIDLQISRVNSVITSIDLFDISFAGFNGERIKGWLRVPKNSPLAGPAGLPAIVEYLGYSHGRGYAEQNLETAASGFVHFVMDSRGQGWHITPGSTSDSGATNPSLPGFMTRGIESRETYYYRRLFTDAARAITAVRAVPEVDAARVGVMGTSQGGGLALVAAGLVPDVAAAVARVPFLCDFPRAFRYTDAEPYAQIAAYLRSRRDEVVSVDNVLRYFDGVNHAARVTAPILFTTSLMDPVCPPATVFGAYHAVNAEKSICAWEFNGHEGGGFEDHLNAIEFMYKKLAANGAQQ